jgi:hypothetical protein
MTYVDKDTGTVWTKRQQQMHRRPSEILQNTHDWVWRWQDEMNVQMTPLQFKHMQEVVTAQWVQDNLELAKCLQAADYKSKFEQQRKQIGYRRAKDFTKRKARAGELAKSERDPYDF